MRLNGVKISLKQVESEQVDGVFVAHDRDSEKVLLFNETSSLIWRTLLDHESRGLDVATIDIVTRLLEACGLPQARAQEVSDDVDEALQRLFHCGLIQGGCDPEGH